MSYYFYDNLRNYFSDYYINNSNQIDIYDPYSKYELDIYNQNGNNNRIFVLSFIFFLYITTSLIYINKMKLFFNKKLSIYHEKLDKIQHEKTNMNKKYQNLIQSIKKIKEISLRDDRSAKKVCLISSEIQSKFNRM